MELANGTRRLASGRLVTFRDGKVVNTEDPQHWVDPEHEAYLEGLDMQAKERAEDVRVAEFKMARDAALASKPVTPTPVARRPKAVPMGTYTVVKPDGSYRTLQVAPAEWAKENGRAPTVISYLSGPDNNLSYTSCAFLKDDGRFNLFKKFKTDSQLVRDINTLVRCDVVDAHERFLGEAEAYAIRSGKCMRCNHKLTVPASLHRGLGPVCAGIEGV